MGGREMGDTPRNSAFGRRHKLTPSPFHSQSEIPTIPTTPLKNIHEAKKAAFNLISIQITSPEVDQKAVLSQHLEVCRSGATVTSTVRATATTICSFGAMLIKGACDCCMRKVDGGQRQTKLQDKWVCQMVPASQQVGTCDSLEIRSAIGAEMGRGWVS